MLQKNHHIIAIDQVSAKAPFKGNGRPDNPLELELKTDSTLSGNGTVGNELGVKNGLYLPTEIFKSYSGDPVMYISGSGNIEATSARDDDNKLYYQLHVQASPSATPVIIQGQNGINAYEDPKDSGKWFVGLENEYYTKHWVTSADDSLAGKSLVLKDNRWVPANEASGDIITTNTFNTYSSFVNNNFVTNSSFSSYSSYVDNSIHNLTNIASSYSSFSSFYYDTYNTVNIYSGYWNNVYSSVSSYSSYWNNHSALSATKLDKADSGLFMQVAKLQGTPDEKLSGYDGSAFYIPDIPEYSGKDGIKVDGYWIGISADYLSASENFLSANALDNLSGNWDSVYDTVNDASARWDAHSALSAEVEKKLDASESAKFMKVAGLEYNEDKISGYAGSAFYVPAVHDYKGGNGIEITDEYIINISADYLSANALDNLSGNWDSVYSTVETYSGDWNEASAFSANSGKFVTSGEEISDTDLAYVLKKTGDNVAWSGVDLSELGKIYPITSLTLDLVSATVSAVDGTQTYVLSAAAPVPFIPYEVSASKMSAWSGISDDKKYYYFSGANISGNNGISAAYNSENNQWDIGISADACAYFAGLYATQAAITGGTLIPYESNTSQNITIDEYGYIRLPDDGNKFTFCINETVENNISTAHNYCLNQISLIKVDENEVNEPEIIVSTHDYYPTEVGASDTNIALTIRHVPGYKYAVKYDGADLSDSVTMRSKISIIEEIVSLSNDSGQGNIYGGVEPVFVDNDSKLVGLSYDRNQFKAVVGADSTHPSLKALQLDIQTSGGTIDQEAFEKLANLVYGRITETIPIGMINAHDYLSAGQGWSYLFRPIMDFDVSQHTVARIMTHNASVNASKVLIVICRLDESDSKIYVEWFSNLTTLTKQKGTHTLTANPFCTETRTLHPEMLYYVVVLNLGQTTHFAGFKNEYNDDAGDYDIAYWTDNALLYSTAIINYLNNVSVNALGQTGNSKLKPYVGFRNEV